MSKPSIFQFSQEQITSLDLKLVTKPRSQMFGRRLYTFSFDEQQYWLKAQIRNTHKDVEQGFLREMDFYQQIAVAGDFSLPFSQMEWGDALFQRYQEHYYPGVLILPHAISTFDPHPEKLSASEIHFHILSVLELLDGLYKRGYLHADLKAEHFVHYAGKNALIDFEQIIPQFEQQSLKLTATPRYMAPELFHGDVKSAQSEIYALGIILLEWLTQQRLSAKTYQEWAVLHCQTLKVELPVQFQVYSEIIKKMLSKKKDHRFVCFEQIKYSLMLENV
ncbi:hypothetical protein CDG60_07865 [Acinetobacter chinensis]|uniref:Protein kinase domain-containing protein n=1 Tax=Acinetobacter chinensis TaxID=2004650 RepID=A0A3B7M1N6_9GAMM|nr:protein kinase [Acinetobacter chinensis]AXY56493.1 hypothetical protein CDG60_07865 [Acinetobacter chinensis]